MPSDQRTEPATPRRLARARREGDHPISTALLRVSGTVAAAALLPLCLAALMLEARNLLGAALQPNLTPSPEQLPMRIVWLVTPLLGGICALTLAAGFWQTGGVISSQPLAWQWQRLTPRALLSRVTSASRGVWTATSLLGLTGSLLWLGYALLKAVGAELAASVGDLERASLLATEICQRLLWWSVLVGLGVATLDALVQRGAWLGRLRMTREEREREQRESEGDPALRHERKRVHRELLDAAQLSVLPGANLIVFDGPRLAVALRYDAERDRAPIVLLQAYGVAAGAARAAAELYRIPVSDDAFLAKSLARVAVDAPIPSQSFAAVAAALRSGPDTSFSGR